MRTLITTLILACLLPLTARAAIIDVYVTSSANSGAGTLRQAILDANAHDLNNNGTNIHIQLANGNPIILAADLPVITARVITIAGDSGYYPRINGLGSHGMFRAELGVLLFTLRNLHLEHGQSTSNGGGCVMSVSTEGTISIKNVFFVGCEAIGEQAFGGAVYVKGAATIEGSSFYSNYANGHTYATGGAIYSGFNGSLTITDCRFVDNHAVAHAVVTGLASGTAGGAVSTYEIDTEIEHSDFVQNAALSPADPGSSYGGAVHTQRSNLRITRSTLIANQADNGGAIHVSETADPGQIGVSLINNLFVRNTAQLSGGALYAENSITSLRNNTFWHNRAEDPGDNLSGTTGSVIAHASNNLFMAGDGSHDSCEGFTTVNPTTASVYNILPAAECGLGTGPGDQITQGVGIIGLKYEAAAPSQSYVWLVQDSPAIEGAYPGTPDDDDPYACPELDGPGNTRPAQGMGIPGSGPPVPARCDIGAWESPGEAPLFYGSFDDPLAGFQ